jgi:hypothetical protein
VTTGQQLVDAASTFLGEPYSTAPGRTSPTSGYKDCSGMVAAAYEVATGGELGAYVTVSIYRLCRDQGGKVITRDEADGIAGACYLMPEDPEQGWGPLGHIGFSTGDGSTIEATPAARGGVQRLPNRYQPWGSVAVLLPGIDYSNAGQGGAQPSTRKGQHMIYVDVEAHVALAMEGPVIVAEFNGPPNQYGIPQDAMDYAGTDIPLRVVPGLVLAKLRKADEIALTPPVVTTVPGDCPPLTSYTAQDLVEALATVIG